MSTRSGGEIDEDGTGTRRVPGARGGPCVPGRWGVMHGEGAEAASVDCCSGACAVRRFRGGRRSQRPVWALGGGLWGAFVPALRDPQVWLSGNISSLRRGVRPPERERTEPGR